MSDTHLIGALCPPGRRHDWTPLWVGALAAVASGAACAVVYAIASALGAIPHGVVLPGLAGDGPPTPGLVVTAATVAATGAGLLFGVIRLVSRRNRPVRVFRLVALAVFLISLATPFSIQGAPAGMIAALLTMHVLFAAISVGLLTTLIPGGRESANPQPTAYRVGGQGDRPARHLFSKSVVQDLLACPQSAAPMTPAS